MACVVDDAGERRPMACSFKLTLTQLLILISELLKIGIKWHFTDGIFGKAAPRLALGKKSVFQRLSIRKALNSSWDACERDIFPHRVIEGIKKLFAPGGSFKER